MKKFIQLEKFSFYSALLVVWGFILYTGSPFLDLTDSWNHLTIIRKHADFSLFYFDNPYYKIPRTAFRYAYDVYHFSLGLVSRITGIDPLWVWAVLPAVLFPLMMLSLYYYFKNISDSSEISAGGLIVFLFSIFLFKKFLPLSFLAYPSQVSFWIIIPLCLGIFFYDKLELKYSVLLFAVLTLGLSSTHLFYWIILLFKLTFWIILCLLLKMLDKKNVENFPLKRYLTLWVVFAVVAAPFIVIRALDYNITNPFFQKNIFLIHVSDGWYRFPYKNLFSPVFLVNTALVSLGLFLMYKKKIRLEMPQKIFLLFCFSQYIFTFLLLSNPLTVTILKKLITSYFVKRLPAIYSLENYLLISFSVVYFLKKKKCVFFAFLSTVLILLVFYEFHSHPSNYKKVVKLLNLPVVVELNKLPAGRVLLTDEYTGYHLPALTPHFVVSMKEDWASPSEQDVPKRIEDARKVLSYSTPDDIKPGICDKYGVDYIILDTGLGDTVSGKQFLTIKKTPNFEIVKYQP